MHRLVRSWPALAGLLLAVALLAWLQAGIARALTRSIVHTTVADFNRGTFFRTGLTQEGDGEVTLLTIGIAGEWITTTNATGLIPRQEHSADVLNGRIYVFGGKSGGTLTSIQYAVINTLTHNLSNWITPSVSLADVFPQGLAAMGGASLNDFVYLIGGYAGSDDGAGVTSTVIFARAQADGSLTPFTRTASLPQPLSRSAALALNDRIYVLGGRGANAAGRATVYYAQPDAATGVITQWLTATAALPYPAFGHQAFTANDHLYIAGGISGTFNTVPYVYYAAPVTGTGDITASGWISTQVMPRSLYEAAGAAFAGQLYATGGQRDYLGGQVSDYVGAAIPAEDGSIGVWANTSLITPTRLAHAAVVDVDGWIYIIGGSNGTTTNFAPLINAGRTAGTSGASYAQLGRYTSPIIDFKRNYALLQFDWTTTLGDTSIVSLTMRYRYRTHSGAWSNWSAVIPSVNTSGIATTTVPLTRSAQYFQYEATFASNGTATPILRRAELMYDLPEPPDFFKIADPPGGRSVQTGDRITYTLRVTNTAVTTLHNVVISDRVPISTTYAAGSIFASPGVAMDSNGNPILTWIVGDMPPQAGATVGYAVRVDNGVPEGTQIRNTADLASDEIDATSSSVAHTVGYPPGLFKSAVTSAPGQVGYTVQPGDRVTYTLTYSNPSATRALSGVVITDALPANLTYAGWSSPIQPDAGLLASSRMLRWSIGALGPSAIGSIQFAAIVSSTALSGASISNTAQIDSDQTSAFNSNAHDLPVRYRFDLSLTQSDGRTTAQAGEWLTYTVRFTNTAAYPITATGIVITTYLDPGMPTAISNVLSFAGGTPGWSFVGTDDYGSAAYEYAVGSLGPSQSRTITLVARITDTLPAGVLAVQNTAVILDDGSSGVEADPSNQIAVDDDIVAGADLAVTGIGLRSMSGPRATLLVTITNQGVDPTLGPDAKGWFGVDLYTRPIGSPPPYGPGDRYLGLCPTPTDYCPGTERWALYQVVHSDYQTGLAPGESWVLTYTAVLTPGTTFWLYAQTDPFWGAGDAMYGSAQHGRIVEVDEDNNISDRLVVRGDWQVYLPAVMKK